MFKKRGSKEKGPPFRTAARKGGVETRGLSLSQIDNFPVSSIRASNVPLVRIRIIRVKAIFGGKEIICGKS